MPGRAGRMLLRAARAARGLAGRGWEVSGDGAGLQPGGGAWGDPRGVGGRGGGWGSGRNGEFRGWNDGLGGCAGVLWAVGTALKVLGAVMGVWGLHSSSEGSNGGSEGCTRGPVLYGAGRGEGRGLEGVAEPQGAVGGISLKAECWGQPPHAAPP